MKTEIKNKIKQTAILLSCIVTKTVYATIPSVLNNATINVTSYDSYSSGDSFSDLGKVPGVLLYIIWGAGVVILVSGCVKFVSSMVNDNADSKVGAINMIAVGAVMIAFESILKLMNVIT